MITKTNQSLSRRDAIKFIGISAITANLIASTESTPLLNTDAKIVIVGGGSGAITILSRLLNSIAAKNITIIAPNDVHIYQPGQVFVASGVYKEEEIFKNNREYIPEEVTWIKDVVKQFSPEENSLITSGSLKIKYDYLIVATGLEYHYEWIKGLKEEDIGSNGIASVYLNDTINGTAKGGVNTWQWLNEITKASSNKKLTILYSMPETPVKCGAVAQMMLYLSADHLKQNNIKANFIYTPSAGRLFGLEEVAGELLKSQTQYDTITNKFHHKLIEIDIVNKVATYDYSYEEKSGWDEDFQEWAHIEKKNEIVKIPYDFIHIVPPMAPTTAIANSKLAVSDGHYKGWLDVDLQTLQNATYTNVFGIGDICGIPLGKTTATVEKQAVVVEKNLLAMLNKEDLKAKFDGYSVCPIKISYQEVISARFNYDGLVVDKQESKNSRKKDWLEDAYMAKPNYWNSILRGKS